MDQTDTVHRKNSSGKYAGKEFPEHHSLVAWDFIDNKQHGFWLHI